MVVADPPPAAFESSTREAILDAAERRFAERGFEGVSVREIASDAGLKNQASLYHHFEHKQAIYEAVLARAVDLLVTVVEESSRSGGLRASDATARAESLSRYLDRVLDFLVAHPQLARLIQRVSMDDEDASREIVGRLAQPLFAEGVRLLGDARDGWAADELPHLAAGLYHLIFGYFADAALLRSVMADDPMSAAAITRQRRFVHTAVERLLGVDNNAGATR